jgi:hypothetical protein
MQVVDKKVDDTVIHFSSDNGYGYEYFFFY